MFSARLVPSIAAMSPEGVVTVMASARFGANEPATRRASVAAAARTIRRIAFSVQVEPDSQRSREQDNTVEEPGFVNSAEKSGRIDDSAVHRLFAGGQPISYR
jgi:hypothetical protein